MSKRVFIKGGTRNINGKKVKVKGHYRVVSKEAASTVKVHRSMPVSVQELSNWFHEDLGSESTDEALLNLLGDKAYDEVVDKWESLNDTPEDFKKFHKWFKKRAGQLNWKKARRATKTKEAIKAAKSRAEDAVKKNQKKPAKDFRDIRNKEHSVKESEYVLRTIDKYSRR